MLGPGAAGVGSPLRVRGSGGTVVRGSGGTVASESSLPGTGTVTPLHWCRCSPSLCMLGCLLNTQGR